MCRGVEQRGGLDETNDADEDHAGMNDMASPDTMTRQESPMCIRNSSGTVRTKASIAKQNQGVNDNFMLDSTKSALKKVYQALWALNNQHRVKKIDASKHVLETYHDSFLYGKVPSTVKIRAALRAGLIGHLWHFVCTQTLLLVSNFAHFQPESRLTSLVCDQFHNLSSELEGTNIDLVDAMQLEFFFAVSSGVLYVYST